jgi:hypothetical protein
VEYIAYLKRLSEYKGRQAAMYGDRAARYGQAASTMHAIGAGLWLLVALITLTRILTS